MSRIKKLCILAMVVVAFISLAIAGAYARIVSNSNGRTFDSIEKLQGESVGLLLGTVPRLADGRKNLYFEYRLAATLELYHAGKIKRVLVSGDNSRQGYNEPEEFKIRLVAGGMPAERIHLDFAGLRTLDSIVRARKVFGQTQVLVISQRFHNERALYLADHFDLQAQGFNAQDVGGRAWLRHRAREALARVKVFWDIWTGVGPRFLGPPVEIPTDEA